MRIMAHISGDSSLCQLFQSSRDVYVMLASKIFSKDYSAVSPQERNQAKVICLGKGFAALEVNDLNSCITGVIYGMGAKMAAERLGIEISKVYSITTAFFTKFNGLREWMICVKREAAKQGFVATIFGRRRYLPEINSSNTQERAKGERQAVNTVIQGSASDLLKHVMLRIECLLNNRYSSSKNFSLRPRVLMQVHDELIYELPICNSIGGPLNCNPVVINFASSLVNYMTMTVVKELSFNVPLEVNVTVGFDWGHMQKLEINGRHVESDFKGVVDGNTSLVTDLSSSVRTVVEPDYSEDIDVAITEHIIVPPPLQMSLLNTNSTVGRRSVD